MNKTTSKILTILLFTLLFVFAGLFISTRYNIQHLTFNNKQIIPSPTIYISTTTFVAPSSLTRAKVVKVIDGDTIELTDKTRVRYIGINTPELANSSKQSDQCFATQSAYINQQLVEGQEIQLGRDASNTDKYGRLLRYVYVDDVFVNDFLIRQGYARIETIPPDTKYSQTFLGAEKEAKTNNRGLWGKCSE